MHEELRYSWSDGLLVELVERIAMHINWISMHINWIAMHINWISQQAAPLNSVPLNGLAILLANNEVPLILEPERSINPLTPNDPYSGRTAPLTSKVAFYVFIQQI